MNLKQLIRLPNGQYSTYLNGNKASGIESLNTLITDYVDNAAYEAKKAIGNRVKELNESYYDTCKRLESLGIEFDKMPELKAIKYGEGFEKSGDFIKWINKETILAGIGKYTEHEKELSTKEFQAEGDEYQF